MRKLLLLVGVLLLLFVLFDICYASTVGEKSVSDASNNNAFIPEDCFALYRKHWESLSAESSQEDLALFLTRITTCGIRVEHWWGWTLTFSSRESFRINIFQAKSVARKVIEAGDIYWLRQHLESQIFPQREEFQETVQGLRKRLKTYLVHSKEKKIKQQQRQPFFSR